VKRSATSLARSVSGWSPGHSLGRLDEAGFISFLTGENVVRGQHIEDAVHEENVLPEDSA